MLVCGAFTFAIYYTYQSFKTEAKHYPYVAILGYLEGFGFCGIVLSFIWVLMGRDANELAFIVPRISYTAGGAAIWICMYIAWDTFFKAKYKKPVLIFLGIGVILYYIVIYAFMDTMVRIPKVPRGEILDDTLWEFRLAWWALMVFIAALLIFFSGSFFRLMGKVKGLVRKKVTYLFIGFTLQFICCAIDMMIITPLIFINRLLICVAVFCWFKGL